MPFEDFNPPDQYLRRWSLSLGGGTGFGGTGEPGWEIRGTEVWHRKPLVQ
jgi:hypothetical protein